MGCFKPLTAYQSTEKKPNGKSHIHFGTPSGNTLPIQLPCGQCIGCRLDRSRQWATRCHHEASLYEDNCFITLTYDPEHLPSDGSIDVRHFQLFMKRLRKHFTGRLIRFFHCGEYGENFGRPHYHACLFNLDFKDLEAYAVNHEGKPRYTSPTLKKIWGKGHVDVGRLTFESAAYVARYIMKKINGEKAFDHYMNFDKHTGEIIQQLKPEYTTMSRRPGIAKKWFEQFKSDIFPHDYAVINGKQIKPPKYYDTLYEIDNPELYVLLKDKRAEAALLNSDDNTTARLDVKERILKTKLKQIPRNKI